MNDKEKEVLSYIEATIQRGCSNDFLVQLIELGADYLNLETIANYANYAKQNKLSYNGVKYHRKIIKIKTVKFVIDNG